MRRLEERRKAETPGHTPVSSSTSATNSLPPFAANQRAIAPNEWWKEGRRRVLDVLQGPHHPSALGGFALKAEGFFLYLTADMAAPFPEHYL